ncbi:hypothetical protein [Saccharibacillus sacchari]|uniref:hypothetical protein n=1 Tax=Saccharibacillus sacchari TaxID=456493 RepID=UPI0004AC68A9|nr:hypothetical protein [Saccharibacillus sacchari]
MQNRKAQGLIFSMFAFAALISGCGSVSHAQTANQPTQIEVSATTHQILPNGEQVLVEMETTDTTYEETAIWRRQKQDELKVKIGEIAEVNPEDIALLLGQISDSELSCSMVLRADVELDSQLAHKIKESVINAIAEDPSGNKIKKESIAISNSKGEVF